MHRKTQYRTKQREELLAYLKSIPGTYVTVNEIHAYFKQIGNPIGTTTIYRHLDRMVAEGLVNKYLLQSPAGACYEYVEKSEECGQSECFHCKCEKCGQMIHLHCNELIGVRQHMSEHHGFDLNPLQTIFYGVCNQCKENGYQ